MYTGQRVQNRPQLVTDALITLTHAELRTSAFIGKSRNKKSRDSGVFDSSVSDTHMIDIIGAEAELAFAKLCNLYPKDFMTLGTRSKAEGTDDGDLNIDGVCVDVKTTTHKNGMLLSNSKHTSGIDLFALMIKKGEDTFQLKGFMLATELIVEDRFGRADGKLKRPTYVAKQDELYCYKTAVRKLKKYLDTVKS